MSRSSLNASVTLRDGHLGHVPARRDGLTVRCRREGRFPDIRLAAAIHWTPTDQPANQPLLSPLVTICDHKWHLVVFSSTGRKVADCGDAPEMKLGGEDSNSDLGASSSVPLNHELAAQRAFLTTGRPGREGLYRAFPRVCDHSVDHGRSDLAGWWHRPLRTPRVVVAPRLTVISVTEQLGAARDDAIPRTSAVATNDAIARIGVRRPGDGSPLLAI